MKSRKKKWMSLMAAVLCFVMAINPVTVFAESDTTNNTEPGEVETILSDDFDELVQKAEEMNREHEAEQAALANEQGIEVTRKTYGSGKYDFNVDLNKGETITYNGYSTHQYSLSDGTVVYCIEPSENSPSNGQYTASVSTDALMSAIAYYGYGGPGYETDYGMYHMLDSSIRPYAYVITHMALSWVYDGCSEDSDAFVGNQHTADGIKNIVNVIGSYAWTVPADFAAFTFGTSGQTMGFGYYYNPTGSVQLKKTSANPAISDGNSCYSLAGAVYGVYGDEGCTDQKGTLTTDESGNTNAVELSPGTYWVKETVAPKGYALDTTTYKVTITGNQTTTLDVQDEPQADPVRIALGKVDKDTNANKPQGSASLAGAEYTVKYYAGMYDTDPAAQGQTAVRTWVLRTKENGRAEFNEQCKISGDDFYYIDGNPDPFIPLGTITIQETKAPEGYLIDNTVFVRQVTPEGDLGTVNTYNQPVVKEQSIRGGVKIQKRDYETNDDSPMGGSTFEGAEFAIINNNENPVVVNGVSYANGETVMTLVSDKNGFVTTTADALPYGLRYKLVEIKAPTGYLLSGVTEIDFSITENGVIVDLTASDKCIKDKVKRGDFEIRKIDSKTQDSMADIEFEITNIVTGECHKFTTDENGYYSSENSWNVHSHNTNIGGAEDGMWFSQTVNGATAPVQDSLGALPHGIYVIDELPGINNAGKEMFHGMLYIRRDKVTVDLGNIENEGEEPKITITTHARDAVTGTQMAQAGKDNQIIDEVTLEGTIPGREYVLKGTVMDRETKKPYMVDDKAVTAELTFTADAITEIKEMTFDFDGTDLAGKGITVYEELYYRGRKVAEHTELGDKNQMVYFPEIKTKASDKESGLQTALANKNMTIIDKVSYSGLIPGKTYIMSGVVLNQKTEEAILVNGKEVTAELEFTPEQSDGTVELSFTFDGTGLEGQAIVVGETCYYEDVAIAVHMDITDKDQTIYIPKMTTHAIDAVTGTQMANASKDMNIVDTADISNLMPGETYILKSVVMDKSTEKPLLVDGKEVTAELEFTPEEKDCSIEVPFVFDGSELGGEDIVVFQRLYVNDQLVAEHTDITDENQTIHIPKMTTHAIDAVTGTQMANASKDMNIVDTADIINLMPGETYVLKSVLMDKSTEKPLLVDGKEVTAETEITPEEKECSIEVPFVFDGSELGGKDIVVFQRLYVNDQLVAEHTDLEDENQTIHIEAEFIPPKTGVNNHAGILLIGGMLLLMAASFFAKVSRKPKKE